MSFANGGKIVTNGLVLALDASDRLSYPGSGTTWTDISGNGYNGTLTNGPTFSSGNGGSITFDGSDDFVSLTGTINLGNTFTILAWIKPSTLAGGDYIVYGTDANGNDNWFGINGNAVNLFATQASDVNNFTISGGSITSTSIWYFIGCTINVSTAKVYLNAVEQNSTTRAFTIGSWNSATNSIGRRGSINQRYFPGNIASVQAYNRVLTTTEMLINYNASKSRFGLK
jgi:hypothetical protein